METVSLDRVNGKSDGVWFDLGLGTVWNRRTGQYFELVRNRDGKPVCYKELSGSARSCIEAEMGY